jgi:putative transposase
MAPSEWGDDPQQLRRGGRREVVAAPDLPEPTRRAVLTHLAERDGLARGTYDEAAHAAFLAAPARMRAEAERKAELARFLIIASARTEGVELPALVPARFGPKGTSKASLKRLPEAIEGVDPITYALALLVGYKGPKIRAAMSEDASRLFLSIAERGGAGLTLRAAWRDVRDLARRQGRDWPSYATVHRRWTALPDTQRMMLREGHEATVKARTLSTLRDKTTIGALGTVSLDGRMLDLWADFGEGRAVRPIMSALVDMACSAVLDFELAPSENAAATVRPIARTCEAHGIFDQLYTDNGSALGGHVVAGGVCRAVRTGGRAPTPPGICQHLGIRTAFALPGNAKAKIAERAFATLSRCADDRPEFAGAHAGHAPNAAPGPDVVPVPIAKVEALYRREVARHNHEAGRTSQVALARSYWDVLEAGPTRRITRRPTACQLYLARLVYRLVAVDRFGRVKVQRRTYGGPETQDTLLRFHGGGKRVQIGRDPDDLGQPALAWDMDGRLICEGIEPIRPGAYGSVDGIRQAASNRRKLRATLAAHEDAARTYDDAELAELLAQIPTPGPAPKAPAKAVVAGRFGAPVDARPDRVDVEPDVVVPTKVRQEYLDRLDAHLGMAPRQGRGGR